MLNRKVHPAEVPTYPDCHAQTVQTVTPMRSGGFRGWMTHAYMACPAYREGARVDLGEQRIDRSTGQEGINGAANLAGLTAVSVCAKCPISGANVLATEALGQVQRPAIES